MIEKQHVFIVGSKGIPARYGGFETFVEKLTEHGASGRIAYHVACLDDGSGGERRFVHNGADCFAVQVAGLGPAKAVLYDLKAVERCIEIIEEERIVRPVVYVLASRIGPFIGRYARRIHALGGRLFTNPDGHEFLRAKWSTPVKWYWRMSERLMVKHSDLVICDSATIEQYIVADYTDLRPKTTFIAYGADMEPSRLVDDDPRVLDWFESRGIVPGEYYVNIARIVPENNYRTIVSEFMASGTDKDLVVVASAEGNAFLGELASELKFEADSRIKFVGGIYDQELLKKIRSNAFGYIHGHSVGGTNPSLLEALGNVDVSLLFDVGFNREVAEDSALYWSLEEGDLARTIARADAMGADERRALGEDARSRMRRLYSWERIAAQYEEVFLDVAR